MAVSELSNRCQVGLSDGPTSPEPTASGRTRDEKEVGLCVSASQPSPSHVVSLQPAHVKKVACCTAFPVAVGRDTRKLHTILLLRLQHCRCKERVRISR